MRNRNTAIAKALNIVSLRRAHGMLQMELARLLDRTAVHLSRIERGEASIPMRVSLDIAMLFNKPVRVEYKGRRFTVAPDD